MAHALLRAVGNRANTKAVHTNERCAQECVRHDGSLGTINENKLWRVQFL